MKLTSSFSSRLGVPSSRVGRSAKLTLSMKSTSSFSSQLGSSVKLTLSLSLFLFFFEFFFLVGNGFLRMKYWDWICKSTVYLKPIMSRLSEWLRSEQLDSVLSD